MNSSANVVQVHAAATALGFHAASDRGGFDIAAIGLNFDQRDLPWNLDRELPGKLAVPSALPVPHDPGRVSANIGSDLEVSQLPAAFLLRGGVRTGMDHIMNALLLPAPDDH
jgi:hypothetical protein